jgi:enoyl reductase
VRRDALVFKPETDPCCVGSFAVQLATLWGTTVICTASERNHDYLRPLGPVPMVYGDGLLERLHALAPNGVDAALD